VPEKVGHDRSFGDVSGDHVAKIDPAPTPFDLTSGRQPGIGRCDKDAPSHRPGLSLFAGWLDHPPVGQNLALSKCNNRDRVRHLGIGFGIGLFFTCFSRPARVKTLKSQKNKDR
jgi:hypothetical protein